MFGHASNLFVLSLATIALSGATATKASIELKFAGVEPGPGSSAVALRYNGNNVSAIVGQMTWDAKNDSGTPALINGADAAPDSIMTFCIELGQYVSGSWNVYEKSAVADAVDPGISGKPGHKLGSARAAALDLLADHFWDNATGSDLVGAVAFQFAVWEIVHEFSNVTVTDMLNPPLAADLNVSQSEGSFFVNADPSSGSIRDAIDLANDWLGQLATLTADDSLSLVALTNPGKQDQIIQYATPPGPPADLPEPFSLAVWASLMGVAALATRRSGYDAC
ncbi:hypothetical protein [Botrimarina mediterranea]|uniref:PEP-CTERM protein-sorting domain-containing protein n=1 Tax=Botrimarina mediterranea TaxID=2528022 RepID=A0A518KBK0_9BACT|nr:hypothetical protein [Botrimarina mediterranea]QDV75139.1 hypothetical protein Spa11_33490 [Botrimarina mediterranea]QDV79785.1 hypothetical protein K2D_34010 [Planctomycetes bacterium K2D]